MTLLAAFSIPAVASSQELELVRPPADWRVQDWFDSQGVVAAAYDAEGDCLVLECDLVGGHESKAQGEIELDLKYLKGYECGVPVDLAGSTVRATIEVPEGFVAQADAPSGCQLFIKSAGNESLYGAWQNVLSSGTLSLELALSPESSIAASARVLGLKCSTNEASTHRFQGEIRVHSYLTTPSIPGDEPIDLEANTWPADHMAGQIQALPDGLFVQGRPLFLVGGNWRIIEYGQDFGTNAWFPAGNGVSRHTGYVEAWLETFRRAGVSVVRVFLLSDGRGALDRQGHVVGYNERFRADVVTLLDLGLAAQIKVELVLADYLLAGEAELIDGVWIRGRRAVIEQQELRAGLVNDLLEPLLLVIGDHPALFGFDLLNEPEWLISTAEGGAWELVDASTAWKGETPISYYDLNQYFDVCIDSIRRLAPTKLITIGTSCPYLHLVDRLELDYLAPHYYPWMGAVEECLDSLPPDRAFLLEELPTSTRSLYALDRAAALGASGALPWNLRPGIDDHTCTCASLPSRLQDLRWAYDCFAHGQCAYPPRRPRDRVEPAGSWTGATRR